MSVKVAVLGATGNTGSSIIAALFACASPTFEVTALVRASSVTKLSSSDFVRQGLKISVVDLNGPQEDLVSALADINIVICSLGAESSAEQITLANAALKAGVSRFVPNAWHTVSPPRGVMIMREWKEDVLDHIKKIYLPYTFIDVGWWHEAMIPRVPSGRLDHAALFPTTFLIDQGDTPAALTSVIDIGNYVARIIVDPRTLNKRVFAYGEVLTQNDAIALTERVTGEKVPVTAVNTEQLSNAAHNDAYPLLDRLLIQYMHSVWGRGDNQPHRAEFLGYLNAKSLYPDFQPIPLKESIESALRSTQSPSARIADASFWKALSEKLTGQ